MSVVLDSLFIVDPIVSGYFVFGPCLVMQFLVSFILRKRERAGCFTLIVFSLSSGC